MDNPSRPIVKAIAEITEVLTKLYKEGRDAKKESLPDVLPPEEKLIKLRSISNKLLRLWIFCNSRKSKGKFIRRVPRPQELRAMLQRKQADILPLPPRPNGRNFK